MTRTPEIQAELAATHAWLARYNAAFDMARGTSCYWKAWRLSGTAVQFVDLGEPGILAEQNGQRAALKPLAVEAPLAAWRQVAIGDFNTCRAHLEEAGAIDPTAHYMDAIEPIGFCDLWRTSIRTDANTPGLAQEIMGSVLTMLSCHI